jgi:hypothetical protein
MEGEDNIQDAAAEAAKNKGTGITASGPNPQRLTVTELAPLAIGSNGKPARKVTLTGELPEAIAEQIKPGMSWDGENWLKADGTPVELRELSTA